MVVLIEINWKVPCSEERKKTTTKDQHSGDLGQACERTNLLIRSN